MNCGNCGAPMRLSTDRRYYACDYCTSLYFPEESMDGVRVMDEPGELNCPLCRIPLVLAWIHETQVLHCTRCQGLLINQLAFLSTIRYLRARSRGPGVISPPMDPGALKRSLHCPSCGQEMSTHPYGGPGNIVVDNCPRCLLIWLDREELSKVIWAPGRDRGNRD
jgi:Zn-finger nucleic acid-binding protein